VREEGKFRSSFCGLWHVWAHMASYSPMVMHLLNW